MSSTSGNRPRVADQRKTLTEAARRVEPVQIDIRTIRAVTPDGVVVEVDAGDVFLGSLIKQEEDGQQIEKLTAHLIQAQQSIKALSERVAILEAGKSARVAKVDEQRVRILEYMKARPGEKFTALVLGLNLEMTNHEVGGRLRSLSNAGEIHDMKPDGKTRFFWWEPDGDVDSPQ